MPRPQVVVTITEVSPRRGLPTATGTAFMAFAASGTGTTGVPVRVTTRSQAADAFGVAPVVDWVADALLQGAPEVVVVRAAAANAAAVTATEWTAALGTFTSQFGPGQVLIPGVATAAAHDALLEHAESTGRTVLLDADSTPTVSEVETLIAAQTAKPGAARAGLVTPWVQVPGPAGTTRQVPASVIAAGLAARGDAVVGHANHAPAGDQGRGAGVVRSASGLSATFTDDDLDDLHDAGASALVRAPDGSVQLFGWRSVSDDPVYAQLNTGRTAMQLAAGIAERVRRYLFQQVDGQGLLYAQVEGDLSSYLLGLWDRDVPALFGATRDEAYEVQVADVNTPQDRADGVLRAAVAVKLTQHVERVLIDVALQQEA
jgi:hypothetical protein